MLPLLGGTTSSPGNLSGGRSLVQHPVRPWVPATHARRICAGSRELSRGPRLDPLGAERADIAHWILSSTGSPTRPFSNAWSLRLFYDCLVEEGLARAIPSIDFLASKLSNCKLIGWADAGHLRVAKHWHEIVATVA